MTPIVPATMEANEVLPSVTARNPTRAKPNTTTENTENACVTMEAELYMPRCSSVRSIARR